MEQKYDVTYQFGKAIINVVAPQAMSEEEKVRRLCEVYQAVANAWNLRCEEPPALTNNSASKDGI